MDLLDALSQSTPRKASTASVPTAEELLDESFLSVFDQAEAEVIVEGQATASQPLIGPPEQPFPLSQEALGKVSMTEVGELRSDLAESDVPTDVSQSRETRAPETVLAPTMSEKRDVIPVANFVDQGRKTGERELEPRPVVAGTVSERFEGTKLGTSLAEDRLLEPAPKAGFREPNTSSPGSLVMQSDGKLDKKLARERLISAGSDMVPVRGAKVLEEGDTSQKPTAILTKLGSEQPDEPLTREHPPRAETASPSSRYISTFSSLSDVRNSVNAEAVRALPPDGPAEVARIEEQNTLLQPSREIGARASEPINALRLSPVQPLPVTPIATQIAVQISGTRAKEIEIRLEPEELGKVRITIQPRDVGLLVTLNAERPETLDLLRKNSDELLLELNDMDAGNASLEFTKDEGGEPRSEDPSLLEDPPGNLEVPKVDVMPQAVLETDRLDIRL